MSSKRSTRERIIKPSKLKKTAILLLKLAVTIGAIAYVASKIDFARLGSILISADPLWLAGAFVLFNASKILSSVRLNLYYRLLSIPMTQMQNLILYYIGMFYNLFLPGGISGDGYKIYLLHKRYDSGYKLLTQATLLDRISGLSALLLFAGILFCFSHFAAVYPPLVYAAVAGIIAVIPITYAMTRSVFKPFLPIFSVTTNYAFGVQFLQLLSALCIVYALGVHEYSVDYLTLFLISSVVAVLPISIGGIGLRELTFLYGFEILQGDTSAAVSFSALFFIITLLSSLVGGFLNPPFDEETPAASS